MSRSSCLVTYSQQHCVGWGIAAARAQYPPGEALTHGTWSGGQGVEGSPKDFSPHSWLPKTGSLQHKTLLHTFPAAPADLQASHLTLPKDGKCTLMISRGAWGGCQLLAHNSGSGHLCKKLFPRGRKARGGDSYAQKTASCCEPFSLSASALSTQWHTTLKAASHSYSLHLPGCQCLGLWGKSYNNP